MTAGMMAAAIDLGHVAIQWLAGRLAAGSVQGALVIGVVWLLCWRFKSIPASARATLWWLASLKLLLSFFALPAIQVPLLPPAARVETVDVRNTTPLLAPEFVQAERPVQTAPPEGEPSFWLLGAMAIWLAAVALQGRRLLAASRRLRAVVAQATSLDEEGAAAIVRMARQIGLRATPDVRVSSDVETPQVVGVRRPVVLLPSTLALTPDERAMALCHELMHVRRRDVLLGWVPACAERLFFFHPLARLAAGEYLLAREAACDAAVLQALGVAPQEYGQVLVRLGITVTEPGLSAAGSSRSLSSLKRRLAMLHHTTRPRRIGWLIAGLAALSLLPLQLVARAPQDVSSDAVKTASSAPGDVAGTVATSPRAVSSQPEAVEQQPLAARSPLDPSEQAALAERAATEAQNAIETQKFIGARVEQRKRQRVQQDFDELQKLSEQLESVAQARAEKQLLDGQKTIEELSDKLREFERYLQLGALTDLSQAEAAKAGKEALKLQKLDQAKRLEQLVAQLQRKAPASIDQAAPLTDQIEQLRRLQESIAIQMQALTKQQEALKESQMRLAAEADRIREAIDRANREAGKATPAK